MRNEISSEGLGGLHWNNTTNTIGVMLNNEDNDKLKNKENITKMMIEFFEIESLKAAIQYRFKKGLKVFSDEGCQATVKEFNTKLIGFNYIKVLKLN